MIEGICIILEEDLRLIPSTDVKWSQPPIIPAPGDLMPLASEGTCAYVQNPTCGHKIKNSKNKSLNSKRDRH